MQKRFTVVVLKSNGHGVKRVTVMVLESHLDAEFAALSVQAIGLGFNVGEKGHHTRYSSTPTPVTVAIIIATNLDAEFSALAIQPVGLAVNAGEKEPNCPTVTATC
jgi:hypothetical protein